MVRFADELKLERENRNISLETICATTKVSVRHLDALENGRFRELPGGVFRKGILRSYLHALDLEEQPWIERFDRALRETGAESGGENDWVEFAENVRKNRGNADSRSGARWIGVAVMVTALVVLGWGVWKFVLHGHLAI